MFKKIRDKITEEVQQTSLRLPVSVQQLSQLSPFSGSGGDLSEPSRSPQSNLQDELLVDISEIQPAGDNKDLFSIDEDSREGTPSKSSEFQVVELTDENLVTCSDDHHDSKSQLANHNPFNPAPSGVGPTSSLPPLLNRRRSSDGSGVSEVSGLFPIYEVPGVSFNIPQSDIESCSSEWEDGSNTLDRLSKDTVYQAYLRIRQRYHKYKGRYSDLLRVYQEKERETEKLRDVLTKQQDKAVRRVSELREQCSLEQQAKAHLEQELRSDLEEKDHKIEALQTKVRLLQEGCFGEGPLKVLNSAPDGVKGSVDDGGGSGVSSLHGEFPPAGKNHSHDDFDTVSVGSLGSISTAPTSLESEELVEKLKEDLMKHKTLLSRCMENIRANKEKISSLAQERDAANSQLQEKIKSVDSLKVDHERMLESLRATVESSALSMAETKQQFFEELQTKEEEVERYRKSNSQLQRTIDRLVEPQPHSEEEMEINMETQGLTMEEMCVKDLENKCTELENLVGDLQSSKKNLEIELERLKESSNHDKGFDPSGTEDRARELRKEYEAEIERLKEVCSDYERKNEELIDVNTRLDRESSKILSELNTFKESYSKLEMEKSDLVGELKLSSETYDTLQKANDNFSSQLKSFLKLNNAINSEKIDLSHRLIKADERNELLQSETVKLKTENDALSSELRDLNDENESLNSEVSGLNDENESLHTDYKRLQEENEKLNDHLRDELEKSREREIKMAKELDDAEAKLDYVEREMENAENVRKKLENEKEMLESGKLSLAKELGEKNDRFTELESKFHTTKEQLVSSEGFSLSKSSIIDALESTIKEQQSEIVNLNDYKRDTEKTLKDMKETRDRLDERMKEVDRKLLREISDKSKLEDLIRTVESVVMPHLDNQDGTLCTKLESLINTKKSLQNKVENLSQLNSSYEEHLRHNAIQLQNQTHSRTLNIENEKLVLKMQSLEEKEEVISLEKDHLRKSLDQNLSELETLKSEMNSIKRENKNCVSGLKIKLSEHENRVSELKTKLSENENRVSELKNKLSENENRVSELKLQLNEKENTVSELKIKLSENGNMVSGLETKLSKNENTVSELEVKLNENDIAVSKLKMQLSEKENVVSELEIKLTENENTVSALKLQLNEKETVISELKIKLSENENMISELKNKLSENENMVSDLKDKLGENESTVSELKNKLSENENMVSELKDKLSENESTVSELKNKLSENENMVSELKNKLSENESTVSELKNKLSENENMVSELKMKVIENEGMASEQKVKINENENIISELKMKLCENEAKKSELQNELKTVFKELESSKENSKNNIEELTARCKKAREEISKINNEKMKSLENYGIKLEEIEKDKDRLNFDLENKCREFDRLSKAFDESELSLSKLEKIKSNLIAEKLHLESQNENLSEKLRKILVEKTEGFAKVENKVCELEQLLGEKESQLKLLKGDYEGKIVEITKEKEESENNLKKVLHHQKELEEKVLRIDQIESEKEELERMVREMEVKMSQLEEIHVKKSKEVEEEWQRKIRCELEKIQADHDETLAEREKERAQLTVEEESLRRALGRKDAELARLMDEKDALRILLEEKEEEHRLALLQWEEEREGMAGEVAALREKLTTTENQMERQVQDMETSNTDLRQKIDALQSELSCLERLTKEGASAEERITKEEEEEELRGQVALLTQRIQEMSEREKKYLTQISQMEEEKGTLRKEIEAQIVSCEELSLRTESLKKEMESKMSTIEEELCQERSKTSTLVEESDKWRSEKEELHVEMDRLKVEKTSLSDELQKTQDSNKNTTEALTEQLKNLFEKLKEQQEVSDRLNHSSASLKDQLMSRKESIASLETRLTQKEEQLTAYREALVEATGDRSLASEKECLDIRNAFNGLKSERENLVKTIETERTERDRLSRELEEGESRIVRLNENLKEKEHRITNLSQELEETKQKKEILSRESQELPVEDRLVTTSLSATHQDDDDEKAIEDMVQDAVQEAVDKCKEEIYAEYEMKLKELEENQEEERKRWKVKTAENARQKDNEIRHKVEELTLQWNREKKELERLARVAADAFKSGTDSVDLLKEQVAAQRTEIDDIKRSHKKEIGEFQALLEVKRRRGVKGAHGEVRGGGPLEEAAEFEYLKNILYQYMMGKETQTLSKVLCAVVKFSKDQQRQIVDYEEKKQNLLKEEKLRRESELKEKTVRKS